MAETAEAGQGQRRVLGRLRDHGPAVLSEEELVSLLVAASRPPAPVSALMLSERLLDAFDGLDELAAASMADLLHAGAPAPAAGAMVAAAELARRCEAGGAGCGSHLTSSAQVHAHFGPLLGDEKREIFVAVLLDSRNRIVAKVPVSTGSLGASLVHPREAFRPAVKESAAAVIFVHNHPSGDPEPSREDRRITRRLKEAGEVLGIAVLDHVVVGRNAYFSFADSGWDGLTGHRGAAVHGGLAKGEVAG